MVVGAGLITGELETIGCSDDFPKSQAIIACAVLELHVQCAVSCEGMAQIMGCSGALIDFSDH